MSSAVSVRESETLPLQWLKAYSKGCIIVCPLTDVSWGASLSDNEEVFQRIIKDCDKSSIIIGVARAGGVRHPDEELIEKIADSTNTPIAAVYESRYTDKEDAFAYEVAEAIRTGFKLNDPARPENQTKGGICT